MTRPRSAILVALLFVGLAACMPIPVPTSDLTPTRPPGATRTVGRIDAPPTIATAAFSGPTPTAGPLFEGGSISVGTVGDSNLDINSMNAFIQSALYDSLLRPNPATGALELGLAESYQVSSDAATITFKLRQGIRWHNGDALTAADVAATINAIADPDLRGTPVTDTTFLKKATATDDRTVVVSFSEGYCPGLTSIGTLKIVPRTIAQSSNFPRLSPDQLVGTGPLKLISASDSQLVFGRNADYYLGAPHIDSWTLKLYPNSQALRNAFDAKQIDL